MTTSLDLEIVPEVLAALAEVGVTMTFTVSTDAQSNYDPTSGESVPTEVGYQQIASPPVQVNQRYVDGDLIQIGDCEIILQGQDLAFTPALGMTVTTLGADWDVVGVEPIPSGDLIAAYVLRIRK